MSMILDRTLSIRYTPVRQSRSARGFKVARISPGACRNSRKPLLGVNEAVLKNMLQAQQYFENYSARFAEFFWISFGMFFRNDREEPLLAGKSTGDRCCFA
ncbi:hypothetical protein [Trinickia terrae]|uniref:hypothetical protein n=1 Tax=Trinickia terrae TaxID=2571161 RepID=UPI00146C2CD9|nr:hypothetical protein [Trinickia terrae]